MIKKLLVLILFLFLLIIPIFVLGQPFQQSPNPAVELSVVTPAVKYLKVGVEYHFFAHVYNSSGYTLDNVTTYCSFVLYDNEGNVLIDHTNLSFEVEHHEFEIVIGDGNFSVIGEYNFVVYCESNNEAGFVEDKFHVTTDGLDNNRPTNWLSIIVVVSLQALLLLLSAYILKNPRFEIIKGFLYLYGVVNIFLLGIYPFLITTNINPTGNLTIFTIGLVGVNLLLLLLFVLLYGGLMLKQSTDLIIKFTKGNNKNAFNKNK